MSNERTGVLELTLGDTYIGSAYSPQVEVTDTDTGHEVAITYMSPSGLVTERFDVADGETGPQGPAGFSPTVTITDTPTGHTVTITDADGPHSYFVPNYADEEQQRQDAWDELSGEVTDAISDAQTATSAASAAAQSATSAASSATSAAGAANTATASANTAASSANAAATAANSAATAAGTAADAATTAAGDATDAASAANTAAQAAQEAATEVAPEVAWLWGNQLTGELTGDLLTASDAYSAPPMALTVDGRSTQTSTTGKNLFDKDNAPLGYYGSDGAFHSSGSGSSGYRWWSVPVSEGDVIRWADSTNNYLTGWNGGTFVQLAATRPTSPFTVPSGVDEVRGYTQNSTLDTCIVTKNDADLTYEPYTGGKPSPSPDYPQTIESVDELALAFAGKNLFDKSDVTTGKYIAQNGDLWNTSNWVVSNYIPVAGSIYVSGNATSTSVYLAFYDQSKGLMSTVRIDATMPLAVPTGAAYVRLSVGVNNVDTCQLELGSTATAYEPYEGHTVPIDLQDHVLRSLPDGTRDELHLAYRRPSSRAVWAWYGASLVQTVGVVDLGTLAWTYDSANQRFATTGPISYLPATSNTANVTTELVGLNLLPAGGTVTSDGYTIASQRVWIRIAGTNPEVTTPAAFATWLAAHCSEMYYQLTTPVATDLGEIELPVLPAPNCTVWADPNTGLQMEYVRDTNLVVQSLNAETAIAYASIAVTDGPTATASHATGTYLTMGGTLYKVTSAIAVGETIAAGTNVTATTVMAELIARTA